MADLAMTTTKALQRGTHRAVPVEATLARIVPHLDAMGITRVGMLTGLDRIGLPVAMAVRPDSRTVAVAQGKGLTATAAKVSAIMEAAEGFHAETFAGPLVRTSAKALPAAVDPERLPKAAGPMGGTASEDLRTARLLWTEGVDLADGAKHFVPYELVHADYTVPMPEPVRFQATTNGLAAGNVAVEAQLHALYEVVERDAVALWRAQGGPTTPAAVAIDLTTVDDTDDRALLDAVAAAGIEVAVWDATSDIGLTVCVALLLPRDAAVSSVEPEIGAGCHLAPEIALSRALTEAAQARLTRISGARDDFEPNSYGADARRARHRDAATWLARARERQVVWPALIEARRGRATHDLKGDLATVLEALATAELGPAVWIDLTRAEIGIPIGRVIVPGLEGPWMPGMSRPGARARAWAPALVRERRA